MNLPIASASNSELIELLRKSDAVNTISDADLRVVAARLEELEKSTEPRIVKARKRRGSRADRFSEAQGKVCDARAEMEELRDELQNWRDNLPENLQDSQKANELDDAISELDDTINELESAEGHEVQFPGMFS